MVSQFPIPGESCHCCGWVWKTEKTWRAQSTQAHLDGGTQWFSGALSGTETPSSQFHSRLWPLRWFAINQQWRSHWHSTFACWPDCSSRWCAKNNSNWCHIRGHAECVVGLPFLHPICQQSASCIPRVSSFQLNRSCCTECRCCHHRHRPELYSHVRAICQIVPWICSRHWWSWIVNVEWFDSLQTKHRQN